MASIEQTLQAILSRLSTIEAKMEGKRTDAPPKKKLKVETAQKASDEKVTRKDIDDIRIKKIVPVVPPHCLLEEQCQSEQVAKHVMKGRHTVDNILKGKDDRMFVVCGPCSIHDVKAAKEYASLLKKAAAELSKDLFIIMRVYFEKPRTTVGWKGLINDPKLDGTFRINQGLRTARGLLLDLNEMGVFAGFKNGTSGTTDCYRRLSGRAWGSFKNVPLHIYSNYDQHSINKVGEKMKEPIASKAIAEQVAAGSDIIKGVMIESNLVAGNQKLKPGKTDLSSLVYGCSVTDACMDFKSTYAVLKDLAAAVSARRKLKNTESITISPFAEPAEMKQIYKESLSTIYQWTDDIHIRKITPLLPPECMHNEIPCTEDIAKTVFEARSCISDILAGRDDRLVVIVGPCSIHDTKAALEYAKLLIEERKKHMKDLHIIMRVYFEKPRTTVGWKGLINDPDLDGSYKINKGLRVARTLLADLARLGLPAGVEFLDVMSPQYLAEFVSWGAIGARTTESQIHRELVSAISAPVGFKNGTSGNTKVAIDACMSSRCPHSFLSITKQGLTAIIHTKGNDNAHVILRGGKVGDMYFQNYDENTIKKVAKKMEGAGMRPNIMVDLSHANSSKDHKNQPSVCESVCTMIGKGEKGLMGVMIESHINAGNQKLKPGKTDVCSLKYGVSVTDACMDFSTTKGCLNKLAEAVRARRALAKNP
ncbi:hypothetical protein AAMO2058_000094800 [Amorphochlora amoebiformis]